MNDADGAGWYAHPFDDDKLREECGVFGVFGLDDAATYCALGLHALQHRGQEAAGICTYSPDTGFNTVRRVGYVRDQFTRPEVMDVLPGRSALGHTRYATAGARGGSAPGGRGKKGGAKAAKPGSGLEAYRSLSRFQPKVFKNKNSGWKPQNRQGVNRGKKRGSAYYRSRIQRFGAGGRGGGRGRRGAGGRRNF